MCIIAVKNKGVDLPTEEQLRNCEIRNKDGMGIAILKDGTSEIKIKKDFDTIEDFVKYVKDNVTKEDKCIIHFRLATHGLKDFGNRHPFPITKNKELLRKSEAICKMAVAHNGVISQYQHHAKYSDTQKFIVDILADDSVKNNLENATIRKLVNNFLGGDRLAVMQSDGTVFLWGEWVKEGEIYFSNDSYKKQEIIKYAKNWSYWGYDYNNYNSDSYTAYKGICDGCDTKKWLNVVEDDTGCSWHLCKKCRKKFRKGELVEGLKPKENKVDGINLSALEKLSLEKDQCESCLEWRDKKEMHNYYGTLICEKCLSEVPNNGWFKK